MSEPLYRLTVEALDGGYVARLYERGAEIAACTGPTPLGVIDVALEALASDGRAIRGDDGRIER